MYRDKASRDRTDGCVYWQRSRGSKKVGARKLDRKLRSLSCIVRGRHPSAVSRVGWITRRLLVEFLVSSCGREGRGREDDDDVSERDVTDSIACEELVDTAWRRISTTRVRLNRLLRLPTQPAFERTCSKKMLPLQVLGEAGRGRLLVALCAAF